MNAEQPAPVYGSDLIVDLLMEHGIEAVAFNPGATFRGIHDSLVHDDAAPSIVTCTHEAVAVAVAHGFAKAAGRPMAALLHDVVGLQQGSMAVFNAWCDRVPILLLGGTGPLAIADRRPWIDWIHTANVQAQVVRDFVKWDDQPHDIGSVPESLARAMTTATSSPPGPVYVCFDTSIQEERLDERLLPVTAGAGHLATPTDPAPREDDVRWLASALRQASRPVVITDYAADRREGFELLAWLLELTEASVIDAGARFNVSTLDDRNATDLEGTVLAEADLILAIDVEDLYGNLLGSVVESTTTGVRRTTDATIVHATPQHLKLRAWAQDAQRGVPVDRHLTTAAPALLERLVDVLQTDPAPDEVLAERRRSVHGRRTRARERWQLEASTAEADDAIPAARVAAELREVFADRPWTVVHGTLEGWERRLWDFVEPGQHLGWHGGGGLGYGMGAAIGAAMHLAPDRLCINLQPDGDLLYTASAYWTLANQRVPLLTFVLDNQQYRNTVEHAARVATARGRDPERRYAGAGLGDPATDHVRLAESFGVRGFGPVTRPEEIAPVTCRALEIIEAGDPAVVHLRIAGA